MSDTAWTGVAVAGIAAAYALTSRRLASTPVSAAMVFVGFGILLGPVGLDLVSLRQDSAELRTLVEGALTLVLFTDATTVRPAELRSEGSLAGRLLSIGLVLTIGAGWLLAWPLLPGLTVWEFALVAAILAPTDAALGKSAISDPRVPSLVRQTLNVESGLNDGLVLPFFVLFLAATPGTSYAHEGMARTITSTLLLSPVVGLVIGGVGGRLLTLSHEHGWVTAEWRQIYVLAVAFGAYTVAVVTQGSGFIAAWVAGFAFARSLRSPVPVPGTGKAGAEAGPLQVSRTTETAEDLAGLLAVLSLMFFGAVLLGPALQHLSWRIVGYSVLSLTVVRMVPVALALTGSGLRPPTVAYVGWFGPRGLASVAFGLLVAEEPVHGVELISQVVAITVGLSVLLHGASAATLAGRYGRWYERAKAAATATRGLRESAVTPVTARSRRVGPIRQPEN
ncbi:cation:proton antiporter [Streptacidiphilus fuscans]|uniref:Cation:proton antiporter n=1 Tax=Streptacidiphilus fuscans TaxID=2789292 RepID=A0A931FF41_9ACTN|nr:cation:proton antiporter [Streptacidiphilus fuscans]MBF9068059.1 cation:proton antiporter [Streptacidiphilus fuscans]